MIYNSRNAMLMGGIVPSDITPEHVLRYMSEHSGKKRVFSYKGRRYEGHSWTELLRDMGVSTDDIALILRYITNFLVAAASYGIYGGPRALEALAAGRALVASLAEPYSLIATRIIRGIRKVSPSYLQQQRAAFLAEQDPINALKMMQFAPGVSFRRGALPILPTSLAKRLGVYRTDLRQRLKASGASLRRARKLTGRRDFVPQYSPDLALPLEVDITQGRLLTPDAYKRVAADISDAVRARLARGRASANLARMDRMRQAAAMQGYFGDSPFSQEEINALANQMYQEATTRRSTAGDTYARLQIPRIERQLRAYQAEVIPDSLASLPGSQGPLTTQPASAAAASIPEERHPFLQEGEYVG